MFSALAPSLELKYVTMKNLKPLEKKLAMMNIRIGRFINPEPIAAIL